VGACIGFPSCRCCSLFVHRLVFVHSALASGLRGIVLVLSAAAWVSCCCRVALLAGFHLKTAAEEAAVFWPLNAAEHSRGECPHQRARTRPPAWRLQTCRQSKLVRVNKETTRCPGCLYLCALFSSWKNARPQIYCSKWPVACPVCTGAPFRLAALYAGRVFSNCLKILPLWPLSL
jgi:hypothetical protein